MSNSMESIRTTIDGLYRSGAFHIRRGFYIGHASMSVITNHLIEEAVELQGAVMHLTDREAVKEEAADVMLLMAHLLYRHGTTFQEVLDTAADKLAKNWTTDKEKITALNAGFTRRGRADAN